MVQEALRVVQAQQQRAHLVAVALVSKASDHAIGGPQALDLDHRALAAEIFAVEALRDHPVPPVPESAVTSVNVPLPLL